MIDHSDETPPTVSDPTTPDFMDFRANESWAVVLLVNSLMLILLIWLHLWDVDRAFSIENALLGLFAAVPAAWWCPRRPVIVLFLISGVLWCWIDLRRTTELWTCLVAHGFRISLMLSLIVFISGVKQRLQFARFLARIDSLTGLPNRQAIFEVLDFELSRARRFGRSLSIAMLDCDDFKQINDMHGHPAGDRVLRRIAVALCQSTRAYDCVGRLGGDEFVMIISEVHTNKVTNVIERMRAALREDLSDEPCPPTFSIGVVTLQFHGGSKNASIDSLECLKRVDQAMYTAKRAGGDQTRFETIDVSNQEL